MTARENPSDEALLAAARADGDAFAEFYRRYAPALLGYFARRAGNAELAADLTAETFAAALAGLARFNPRRGSAAGWLFGIARHQLARALEHGRLEDRARRRVGIPAIALDDEAIERIDALAASDTTARQLVTLVGELPDEQRRALRQRVVEERDYADIARAETTSEPAIRKRVSRALERLRAGLGVAP
jgi:RNA polymerase sigma factor (sigma-70 family)